jgi:hypothetical protein
VSDPEAPALDPAVVFAALMRHGVEFVLVGGLASQAHGATRPWRTRTKTESPTVSRTPDF